MTFEKINQKINDYDFQMTSGDDFVTQGNRFCQKENYAIALSCFQNAVTCYQTAFNIASEMKIPVEDSCKKIGEAGRLYKNVLNILGKDRAL